jgi:hypothetical protein
MHILILSHLIAVRILDLLIHVIFSVSLNPLRLITLVVNY